MFSISKLPKRKKSRLDTQDTYKVVCQHPDKYVRVRPGSTLKSARSAVGSGDGINDFVHVAIGFLKKFKKTCVIKVHFSDSIFTKRELEIANRLKESPFVVKHICSYTCLDDKNRWMDKLPDIGKGMQTCLEDKENGKDKLTFIIMEYIENGDVCAFIQKASIQEIKALFLMTAVAIIDMAKYRVVHGDLHSGNILLKFEEPRDSKTTVTISSTRAYTFNTYGIHPLFIDFGRSHVYESKISQRNVVEDILTMFTVFKNNVASLDMKKEFNDMIVSISMMNKPRLSHVFEHLLN